MLLALIGAEASLWWFNPMHIPGNFVLARALGLQSFRATGPAMEPTVPQGQSVLVSSWPIWRDGPQPGDVVAFIYPGNPYIADLKRVVACSGSTIQIKAGVLYVDGRKQDEPYLHPIDGRILLSTPPVSVPPNSYFVLGDNRDASEDSRSYGPIARDQIIGKMWF
jgi:signal peptidase I